MSNEKRIIEIDGVKLEVDMREAKRVNKFKVGDAVKVLVKKYDDYENNYGVIVGFTEFKKKPAIDILYVEKDYSNVDIKFKTITEDTENIEIAHVHEYDQQFNNADVLGMINKQIEVKQEEIRVLEAKKRAFKKHFGEEKQ